MSDSRLAAGTRVGPYEVLTLLGVGGMGEVYRARDVRLARDVALKVLRADMMSDDQLRRFEHEAKAAGALNHPNIVAVYDTGQSGDAPYIVSELLEGETLRERLATGSLGVRRATEYGAQIARGLAAAHDRGIVHRDLKPENVFITRDGLAKILDFGIAKLGRAGEERLGTEAETLSNTRSGTLLGTLGYMSPEQARGLPADHRSDIFSLGALLFEMITGRRAFRGTTPADTLSAILREDPTQESSVAVAGLPASLLRVLRRCLEKAPEDRFQSARDLAFALEGGATQDFQPGRSPREWKRLWPALALAVGALGLWAGRLLVSPSVPPTYQRLTFRLGDVKSARFARDGETIVYSAAWGNEPTSVFSTRVTSRGSQSLGFRDAMVLSISSKDEIALLLHPELVNWLVHRGTLARAPLAGGAPRDVLENVLDADWSPDGRDLAVVHVVGEGETRIEFPIGRVLYTPKAPHWISQLRVSPRGDRVVFMEHPVQGDLRCDIRVADREGRVTTLAEGYTSAVNMAWSPDGGEIWYGAVRTGGTGQQVHVVSLEGRERIAVEVPGHINFQDRYRTGQMLLARGSDWTEVRARARDARDEAELPAADLSFLSDLSDDGRTVLGTDIGGGSGPNFALYLQATDGPPPVWLGEGDGQALSPDGRSALALLKHASPQQLVVVPTGAGETRVLERGPIAQYERAVWDPSGRRVVFSGAEREGETRLWIQDLEGGPPRPVTPVGVTLEETGRPVSPDGARVVAVRPGGVPALYPLAGGDPVPIPGLGELDVPLCFTPDGRELFVARYDETPPRVEKVEIASGRTHPWAGMRRGTPSGLAGQYRILVNPEGSAYAYSYTRQISDLYLATGVK
jgi:serine/threonine protein kinase/Tol biopolymer transport system component